MFGVALSIQRDCKSQQRRHEIEDWIASLFPPSLVELPRTSRSSQWRCILQKHSETSAASAMGNVSPKKSVFYGAFLNSGVSAVSNLCQKSCRSPWHRHSRVL